MTAARQYERLDGQRPVPQALAQAGRAADPSARRSIPTTATGPGEGLFSCPEDASAPFPATVAIRRRGLGTGAPGSNK